MGVGLKHYPGLPGRLGFRNSPGKLRGVFIALAMKFTQYFVHMRQRPDRASIEMGWIEETVAGPEFTQIQSDGRIRKWRKLGNLNRTVRECG
jgi:hypothetical protein